VILTLFLNISKYFDISLEAILPFDERTLIDCKNWVFSKRANALGMGKKK